MNGKKLAIWTLTITLVLGLAQLVIAALSFPGTTTYYPRPSDGSVLTSTSVNFSVRANQTDNAQTTWNLTIWNTSNRVQALNNTYQYLDSVLLRNDTFWNKSITMADNSRHYIIYNVTNVTNGPLKSSRITFNVDVNYNKFVIGSATFNQNITLYKGSQRLSCGPLHDGTGAGAYNFNCTQY